jgi:hypothetical protein
MNIERLEEIHGQVFFSLSCNIIDKKGVKVKFPRKPILTTLSTEQDISKLPALGHF